MCYVQVVYEQQKHQRMPLYVVQGDGPSLFGRQWMEKIRLDWSNIHKIQQGKEMVNQKPGTTKLLEDYKVLFDGELGKVEKVQAQLRIKKGAEAAFFKPRPVPYALKDGITKELERLERSGRESVPSSGVT